VPPAETLLETSARRVRTISSRAPRPNNGSDKEFVGADAISPTGRRNYAERYIKTAYQSVKNNSLPAAAPLG